MTRANNVILALILGATICGAGGCFYVPSPDRPTSAGRAIAENVDIYRSVSIPRAELLMLLGEPDWISNDGKVYIYSWHILEGTTINLGMAAVPPMFAPGIKETKSNQLVLVRFDAGGRVSQIERTRVQAPQTLEQRVEEWIGSRHTAK